MKIRHRTAALAGAAAVAASTLLTQAPTASAATVLTLEGGIVGLQPWLHFTPLQLNGSLCQSPNTCQPVNYFAMPLGQWFNDQGAIKLNQALEAVPDAGNPAVLFGHSQGGQVIYSALRGWAADPATAPDPATVSWVSIGNPENTFGGRAPDPIPADSPYQGTEVIRQYDGWADWPTRFNPIALANAIVGAQLVHPNYWKVDLNDPNNIRYVEGNVTYVFVPNPMLPLVQMTGPLAPLLNPVLDPILRPIVESAYDRPIGPVSASSNSSAAVKVPAARTGIVRAAAVTTRTPVAVKAERVKHAKPEAAAKRRGPLR